MNNVNLIGNITKDPELKKTQKGQSVVNITLAVDRYGKGVDYIDVVVWDKRAQVIVDFTSKGSKIAVEGRLQKTNYLDKSGNKVYVTEVVANQIYLLTPKKRSTETKQEDQHPVYEITEEDLPF